MNKFFFNYAIRFLDDRVKSSFHYSIDRASKVQFSSVDRKKKSSEAEKMFFQSVNFDHLTECIGVHK